MDPHRPCPTNTTKQRFIQLIKDLQVLAVGEFTLKSGASSSFFFNCGNLLTGEALSLSGRALGEELIQAFGGSLPKNLVLVGAAYKGIPLAQATAQWLYTTHQHNVPLIIIRKEAKDHGEGGRFIGPVAQATPGALVVIVDDVFSSGTALREVANILQAELSVSPSCALVLLDRSKLQPTSLKALQFPVHAVLQAHEILQVVQPPPIPRSGVEDTP